MLDDPVNLLIIHVLGRPGIIGLIVPNVRPVHDHIDRAVRRPLQEPAEAVPIATPALQHSFVKYFLRALPASLKARLVAVDATGSN
jgi:hypothetical protein